MDGKRILDKNRFVSFNSPTIMLTPFQVPFSG